jgi:hypothetical protein
MPPTPGHRMDTIEGILILAQETRFQLLDRNGVGHHFILGYGCAAEPEQLPKLANSRIRVRFSSPSGILAHVASRIDLLDD